MREEVVEEAAGKGDEDGEEELHLGARRDVGEARVMEEGADGGR